MGGLPAAVWDPPWKRKPLFWVKSPPNRPASGITTEQTRGLHLVDVKCLLPNELACALPPLPPRSQPLSCFHMDPDSELSDGY